MSQPGPATETARAEPAGWVSLWRLGVAAMMAGILAYIILIVFRLVAPANWGFAIEASTEVVEIELPPDTETRWLTDGAAICTRSALQLPDHYETTSQTGVCGSRAWKEWRIPDPEQVLRLNGGVRVTMQMRPEGGFAMSLRGIGDRPLGDIAAVGMAGSVDIGTHLNLVWTEVPDQTLTLPFSGVTTLGRAVSWSTNRMLRGGRVAVFTADESADKRSEVDETRLILGDQIQLGEPEPEGSWPKGFIRVVGSDATMQVVAFGHANSLHIVRFGESGYDFKPGPIRKLAADRAITFWGSVLAAYMTLILGLQPFLGRVEKHQTAARPAARTFRRLTTWLRRKSSK